MGKRNTGRKLAMQALYQAELRQRPISDILGDFLEESPFQADTKEVAIQLAQETSARQASLDELISRYSKDWDISRINIIDKNLLRLGFYEIQYTDTPYSIVINEILEIAKRYSTDDSHKFINGILGQFITESNLEKPEN